MNFDGVTYQPERDNERLTAEYRRVWSFMRDGQWHTLYEISETTHDPLQGVSARLRDFRKEKFGAHTVERRYVTGGVWAYRLIPNVPGPFQAALPI